ncbi:hypothetical protein [Paraburkholderia saeva]|uniref:hypothetical protein n=1 Tax=Paraburkholderia saeva TaxID=2777537 RepID=UPI001D6B5DE3|nr:hypothetical protein [Paraburkholderia saeva]CAG4887804.1 hypothetical protein R52603_00515 [Paraburkholderia saeva]
MKTIFIAFSALFAASAAMAQVSSNATSSATTASTAGATNAGNAQNLTLQSYAPGSQTIRSTGNAVISGFAGSFSGDYCGGTAGLAVGGPGFSVSGGMPKIDESCVMLRTFERVQQAAVADPANARELRNAALDILAEIDPKVRTIFEKHHLIDAPNPNVATNAAGQQVYAVAQTKGE